MSNLPPSAPVPKLFSIFAEKFRIDNADSLNSFPLCLRKKNLIYSSKIKQKLGRLSMFSMCLQFFLLLLFIRKENGAASVQLLIVECVYFVCLISIYILDTSTKKTQRLLHSFMQDSAF